MIVDSISVWHQEWLFDIAIYFFYCGMMWCDVVLVLLLLSIHKVTKGDLSSQVTSQLLLYVINKAVYKQVGRYKPLITITIMTEQTSQGFLHKTNKNVPENVLISSYL